ncbi:hypothetical protein SUGI_0897850 [Cryptomeria japonica]|nr:hypothetical protein SUGI_0897850 [Cryptomeria japonica]
MIAGHAGLVDEGCKYFNGMSASYEVGRSVNKDQRFCTPQSIALMAECNIKLVVALAVIEECCELNLAIPQIHALSQPDSMHYFKSLDVLELGLFLLHLCCFCGDSQVQQQL